MYMYDTPLPAGMDWVGIAKNMIESIKQTAESCMCGINCGVSYTPSFLGTRQSSPLIPENAFLSSVF